MKKKTKMFAIDVHWTVGKTYEIEAKSREEAERQMWDRINSGDVCVWTDGFQATDDVEVACNGEEDKDGEIEYD